MNYDRKDMSCDVLVIGGGVGGLTAAISLKENNPDTDVLIVEKQTCGYSGKANKGGGVLQYFNLERITPKDFVAFHANTIGCYLGNQNLMEKYVSMNHDMLKKLTEWGVRLPINDDGTYDVIPTGPMTSMIGIDLDCTLNMRKTATKLGVNIIDKVTVNDLLTADDKIAGAIGYSILDGTLYTFNAKQVVLATGSQNYRVGPMWSNGRGDGIAAAYRAGAEMRNPEFGNFAQLLKVNSKQEVVFGENVMYDTYGENVTKNFRTFREPDISGTAIREWYRQMSLGRGPIVLHPDESGETKNETMMFYKWDRPYGLPFWEANFKKAAEVEPDENFEVCPVIIGEQSPVKVGEDMQTTIPGLYAIGDSSYCGSTAPGAVPAPPGRNRGSGILNAVFMGIVCGEEATKELGSAELKPLSKQDVDAFAERIYAPLDRKDGVDPKEVIRIIQKAVGPMEQSVYMSEYRIKIAQRYVEEAKKLVPLMKASDFHGVLTCHEAEAMVLSAEMQFKAAEMRKESRGWFTREDYPMMDNENWLKWIIVKNEGGEMKFDTEDVPINDYMVQPPKMH